MATTDRATTWLRCYFHFGCCIDTELWRELDRSRYIKGKPNDACTHAKWQPRISIGMCFFVPHSFRNWKLLPIIVNKSDLTKYYICVCVCFPFEMRRYSQMSSMNLAVLFMMEQILAGLPSTKTTVREAIVALRWDSIYRGSNSLSLFYFLKFCRYEQSVTLLQSWQCADNQRCSQHNNQPENQWLPSL